MVAASTALLERGAGVLHDGDGGLTVLAHGPMRALAQDPTVGNAPLDFLLGRAADRLHRTTGARAAADPAHAFEYFLRNQIFTMNAPVHPGARRIVARQLMPRAVAGMRPAAQQLAAQVVGGVLDAGEVDLGHDVAGAYVTRFWTDQLGMPPEDATRVQHLMHDMNRMFLFAPTTADREALVAATREYMDLVGRGVQLAWERQDNPLLLRLAGDLADVDLPGGPADLGSLVASNFFDGFHTVGVALTNAAHLLFSHPEALAGVQGDPALVAHAFTEGTRLAAPLMLTTRMASEPIELDGLRIPAGTPLTMIWISGNRDPQAISEPERYRLDRPTTPLTTFGGGARICPGRAAARMLAEVALQELIRPGIAVHLHAAGDAWVPGSGIRQLAATPVTLTRARPA